MEDYYYVEPDIVEIHRFKNALKKEGNHRVDQVTYGRLLAIYDFYQAFSADEKLRVAVLSGSENDPELWALKNSRVSFFNFEDGWDLTTDWSEKISVLALSHQFDLILINQVLEHLPNQDWVIHNSRLLLKESGYIWVNVPQVDRIHGEPHFFYSGFHPRWLEAFFLSGGVEPITVRSWGSEKAVLQSFLGLWSSERDLLPLSLNKTSLKLWWLMFADGRRLNKSYLQITWGLGRI